MSYICERCDYNPNGQAEDFVEPLIEINHPFGLVFVLCHDCRCDFYKWSLNSDNIHDAYIAHDLTELVIERQANTDKDLSDDFTFKANARRTTIAKANKDIQRWLSEKGVTMTMIEERRGFLGKVFGTLVLSGVAFPAMSAIQVPISKSKNKIFELTLASEDEIKRHIRGIITIKDVGDIWLPNVREVQKTDDSCTIYFHEINTTKTIIYTRLKMVWKGEIITDKAIPCGNITLYDGDILKSNYTFSWSHH